MTIVINGTTGISGVDGSAGTPAVQGTDTNTGVFYPAADTVGVSTGGSERMRIDSSGNINIATAGARITGDFSNATLANRVAFQTSTANGATFVGALPNGTGTNAAFATWGVNDPTNSIYLAIRAFGTTETRIDSGFTGTASASPMTFYTGGSERMRVDSSGNVGIGTSSPSFISGYGGLQINGGGNGSVVHLTNSTTGTTSTDGFDLILLQGGSDAYVWQRENASLIFGTNATERMRIDSSGNLLFNSGYGSVATAYGCRAWVNFNGTGTVAIRASGNVTSITDNGTGDYTVNFTNAMPDVNYAVAGTAGVGGATSFNSVIVGNGTASMATGSCRINTRNISGASINDVDQIQVAIFR